MLGLKNECEVELFVHRHIHFLLKCLTLNYIVLYSCVYVFALCVCMGWRLLVVRVYLSLLFCYIIF